MAGPTPGNGVHWTTKELVEKIYDRLDGVEDRLRSLEQRVAANRWVAPILSALLVALVTGIIMGWS